MAIGAAVLTTLAAARTAGRAGLGEAAALTAGYRSAFAVGAALVVVAAVVAVALLRPARGDARSADTGAERAELANAYHAGDR